MEGKGVEPNIVSYNSLIEALGNEPGGWKDAMGVMKTIQGKGLKGDVYTYTSLIKACSKGNQVAKALSFLEAMKVAGVKPDQICFSCSIEACAR